MATVEWSDGLPDYPRRGKAPTLIVIHESVTWSWESAHKVLKRRRLGVHFTVERDGVIRQHVPLLMAAAHAGNGRNRNSVAVEVVNRYYGKHAKPDQDTIDAVWAHGGSYILPTEDQVRSVWRLVRDLKATLSIPDEWPGDTGTFRWGRVADTWRGVSSHHRWAHADGLFPEHYCRTRANGADHAEAWAETLAAASSGQRSTPFPFNPALS